MSLVASSSAKENTIQEAYKRLIDSGDITPDAAQQALVNTLYTLQQNIQMQKMLQSSGLFAKIFGNSDNEPVKGLYIHGDVGRGKSMLMDLFYETTLLKRKTRVHFHAFMLDVHHRLHILRTHTAPQSADPIIPLAKDIARDTELLCFDEFQVTDIADAMLLARLFHELFKHGMIMVATSNTMPNELYKDGLQREHFLPFIDLLMEYVDVVSLDSKQDYRLSKIKSLSTVYCVANGQKAKQFLQEAFDNLTNHAAPELLVLKVKGRKLHFDTSAHNVVWTDFNHLCAQALGAEDYIELAREFNTLLLEDIPQFNRSNPNECKRFITLIDALYEHKVKLICTAAATPPYLYQEGKDHDTFQRTASRLMAMKSENYISKEHIS